MALRQTLRALIDAHREALRRHDYKMADRALELMAIRMEDSEKITLEGDEWTAPEVLPKNVVPFTFN